MLLLLPSLRHSGYNDGINIVLVTPSLIGILYCTFFQPYDSLLYVHRHLFGPHSQFQGKATQPNHPPACQPFILIDVYLQNRCVCIEMTGYCHTFVISLVVILLTYDMTGMQKRGRKKEGSWWRFVFTMRVLALLQFYGLGSSRCYGTLA